MKIGEEYAAQLMFVIGGNESSIKHENWAQNLKFAIKVQKKQMNYTQVYLNQ